MLVSRSAAPSKRPAPAPVRSPSPPGATTRSAATPTATAPPPAPPRGAWGGITPHPAGGGTPHPPPTPSGGGNPNPTLSLDHVKIAYSGTAVNAQEASTSITNSAIEKTNGEGIVVSSPIGVPTVTGDTVNNAANTAIRVESASLDMGKLNGNSGSGNGLSGVQLGADTVTVSSALPWSGNLVPVLYGGCAALTVAPKVKLTLGAGTLIKAQAACGPEIQVRGPLKATGTGASPDTFPSWRDDSIGGD